MEFLLIIPNRCRSLDLVSNVGTCTLSVCFGYALALATIMRCKRITIVNVITTVYSMRSIRITIVNVITTVCSMRSINIFIIRCDVYLASIRN